MPRIHSNCRAAISCIFFLKRSNTQGVKRCEGRDCVRSACVVTGVAARRFATASTGLTGLKTTTRGRTTVVPTAGFHEEAVAPRGEPLAVVTSRGFARAQATLSVIVQLTRRTRRTKTLLQVLWTAVGASSRR